MFHLKPFVFLIIKPAPPADVPEYEKLANISTRVLHWELIIGYNPMVIGISIYFPMIKLPNVLVDVQCPWSVHRLTRLDKSHKIQNRYLKLPLREER